MTGLILLLAAAVPFPQFAERIPTPRFAEPSVVEVQVEAIVRTPAEKAQDETYLAAHHWRLSAGSCGMLGCTVHGGKWVLEKGPTGGDGQALADANRQETVAPAVGRWVTVRRGLFRTQTVWQPASDVPEKPNSTPAPAGTGRTEGDRPAPRDGSGGPGAGCAKPTCSVAETDSGGKEPAVKERVPPPAPLVRRG